MSQSNDRNRSVFRPQRGDQDKGGENQGAENQGAGDQTPRVEDDLPPTEVPRDVPRDLPPETVPDLKAARRVPEYESTRDEWKDRSRPKSERPAPAPRPFRSSDRDRERDKERERERGERDRERGERGEGSGAPPSEGSRSAFARTGGETRGRMKAVAPDPRTVDKSSPDTVPAMRAVDYDPSRSRTPAAPRPTPGGAGPGASNRAPQRPGNRPSQLPKPRRVASPTPGRFGFFGFLFGLIGLVIRMLIVTILVGGLVGFASYMIIQIYVKTPEILVPDVKGHRIQEAFDVLSSKKLAMIQERAEPSALVAPGEVIEQRPAAGTKTKAGTTIRLVVSSGKSNFVVPAVEGESRDSAINKIKGAQLEVGNITFMPDDKVPADTVISQNPEANKGLEATAKVNLLISSGPAGKQLSMPDVSNLTVAEARAALARLGINDVATNPPDAGDAAKVTTQDPLVGKTVFQSQKVVLNAVKR